MKMNPVVHFEMPADDSDRIAKFYTGAFGWKAKKYGEELGNYVLVWTAETDPKTGMLKRPGAINGGFFRKDTSKPAQYPNVVIGVEDIKESMKMIEKAGGKVIGEPMEIPGYGMYVSFYDTEGNRNSIMEPTREWQNKAKTQTKKSKK